MAALNFTFKDSTGTTQTARGTDDGTGNIIPMHVLSAGEEHIGQIGGKLVFPYNEFTRPANTTAYTAGDVVSQDAAAIFFLRVGGGVTPLARISGGSGYIVGARITTNKKSITPRIRIHIYNQEGPISVLAFDNLPYEKQYVDEPYYLGYIDLPAMTTPTDVTNSDISTAQDLTIRFPFITVSSVYLSCYLETLDAFTPAANEKFNLMFMVDQN